eukprot:CAMPEP_0184293984 /NCGR_PEP_ID=MMETSP1049-20130417/5278_1 /TAXON_ID=77928 /ORGANISM="Proteomonas sulcata, Strain CCMP704" /LENGTH=126 /DNA_ID=CAMNT_0026602115 /DNA_START=1024 /DNA_END=1404 /DNA_ORIENTATION=+
MAKESFFAPFSWLTREADDPAFSGPAEPNLRLLGARAPGLMGLPAALSAKANLEEPAGKSSVKELDSSLISEVRLSHSSDALLCLSSFFFLQNLSHQGTFSMLSLSPVPIPMIKYTLCFRSLQVLP